MNKFGFKLVFEVDKFVLFQDSIFVGKGYPCNGMFKLNVRSINKMNKSISFTYVFESSTTLWIIDLDMLTIEGFMI